MPKLFLNGWVAWAVVLAAALACGAQASRLAWSEYELASADPGYRLQTPETLQRIERAGRLELDGHPKAAEHELLIAAANDRRYLSAWALANFYQRQRNPGQFWPWAERAIQMSHGDRSALYTMLLGMGPAQLIRVKLPPDLLPSFGSFLVSAGKLDEAIEVLPAGETQSSLTLAERLISVHRLDDALKVWNRSQSPPLDSASPGIVNGDFRRPPTGLGFDWRLGAGTVHSRRQIAMAGGPGEFASQYLVLAPGRCYRLMVDQEALSPLSGLRWQIDDVRTGGNLLADAPPVDGAHRRQVFEFRTPASTRFARLALASRGEVRGTYILRGVSLGLAD